MIKALKLFVVKLIFSIKEFIYKRYFKQVIWGGTVFYGKPIISTFKNSNITIGNNVVLCSTSKDTALGVNHPVILRTLSKDAKLTIGDDTGISGATICAQTSVSIGNGCLLGANVTIMDTDFHPIKSLDRRYDKENITTKKVLIKDNVFIGCNSIILKGVTIGKNSVIAAGSVVSNSIPDNVIAGGNPAKVIKEL